MLEILGNEVLVLTLMVLAFAIAVVCAIISFVKESRDHEKIASQNYFETDSDGLDKIVHAENSFENVDEATQYNAANEETFYAETASETVETVASQDEQENVNLFMATDTQTACDVTTPYQDTDLAALEKKAEIATEYQETVETTAQDEVEEISKELKQTAKLEKQAEKEAKQAEKLAEKKTKQAEKLEVKKEKQAEKSTAKEEKLIDVADIKPTVTVKEEKVTKPKTKVAEANAEKPQAKATTTKATPTAKATAPKATTTAKATAPKATTTAKAKTADPSEIEAKIFGKYTINEVADEGFQFTLFDNKSKKIFQSVTYSTQAICVKNIGYFKKNVQIGAFSVDGDNATGYRFVLKRGVVTYVGVSRKTSAAAENSIEAVKKFAQTDVIV